MLKLITGKAGTGKTARIISEIHDSVINGRENNIMLVPEQYSHEAERELCAVCGDTLSLYAEVFSFTGLARRVRAMQGGGAAEYLDKGGRLLCMALALGGVGSRLKIYSGAVHNSRLQEMLLAAVDELKTACISSEMLLAAAESCDGSLGYKLKDMALILEAFDACAANGRADPSDMLSLLAAQIPYSNMGRDTHIYIDGFTDFTMQERNVITALLKKGVDVTVCLTVDDMNGDNEVFELSRRAGRQLISAAKDLGQESIIEPHSEKQSKDSSLEFYTDRLFTYTGERYDGESVISLEYTDSMTEECELAAAKVLELVREKNCRWRDIAVAVRNSEEYSQVLSHVFEQYGVPVFMTGKTSLADRPLPLLISLLYDIIARYWDADDVISYLRTGLTGLDSRQCDMLESYIFKWQLRRSAWTRTEDWKQHPDGYGCEYDEESRERLRAINELRRFVSAPILHFQQASALAKTAQQQCTALSEYFRELRLPEILEERAARLCEEGRMELAEEYSQLWQIVVNALEQTAAILGERPMETDEFGKLFLLTLSKYDIATIPVALDRVSAGDFDRMRRRSIKHLLVLGASDSRLPQVNESEGAFTDVERRRLAELDISLGSTDDGELWREFSLIYNCLTLPSESLSICYCTSGEDGQAQRASFVYNRAEALMGVKPRKADMEKIRLSAKAPAMMLAAHCLQGGTPVEKAAAEYFEKNWAEKYNRLRNAAELTRGTLSRQSVRALYGERIRLSASRIDKFASCKFAYFCRYGLKAKPYEPAGFKPPEIGTFMHYILENIAREVKELGGFKKLDDEKLAQLTDKYVEKYVHEELNDFEEKSARFIYLFKRLCRDVRLVAADTAAELRSSDFEPLDFELDFGNASVFRPVELGDGEYSMTLTGIADRVDGWLHEGKLYLRVVDYKTGRKKFSMSDIWYGMGLQMLLYLFALEADGEALYNEKIVPAGVMYLPARNAVISASFDMDAETAQAERRKELRRSGLVLDDEKLINAWENGEDKRYIPVKFRKGIPAPEDVASLERLGLLSKHIRLSLTEMAAQLRRGNIAADPYYCGQQENACLNCEYFDACHFEDGENGEHCRHLSKLKPELVWSMLEGGEENNA